MNKQTKSSLEAIVKAVDQARAELETILENLQAEYDDLSEKAQEGEKGEQLNDQIEKLSEASDSGQTMIDLIEEATA